MDQPLTYDVPLTVDERDLLVEGLVHWGGPATCTEELAVAIGFKSVEDLLVETDRIRGDLREARPLTRLDWTRALLSTEIMFASDMMGAGVEWSTVTGFLDNETVVRLRGLQRKLIHYRVNRASIGTSPSRRAHSSQASANEREETAQRERERDRQLREQSARHVSGLQLLPQIDDAHTERLQSALGLIADTLEHSPLAQQPAASTMGIELTAAEDENDPAPAQAPQPNLAQLCDLAIQLRAFVLQDEQAYFERVSESLIWFAKSDLDRTSIRQLAWLWQRTLTSNRRAVVNPVVAATDSAMAAGGVYSLVVHAEDANALLDHITDRGQTSALLTLVGDWLATVAHQQWLINAVRPDLCPELSPWAGSHTTIFKRLARK